MAILSIEDELDEILKKDPRYSKDAYLFVIQSLALSARSRPGENITPKQVLEQIRICGAERFGTGAPAIFREWGVHSSRDFGVIIFNMIDQKLLKKDVTETLSDFETGLDFATAFPEPFYKNKIFLAICLGAILLFAFMIMTRR